MASFIGYRTVLDVGSGRERPPSDLTGRHDTRRSRSERGGVGNEEKEEEEEEGCRKRREGGRGGGGEMMLVVTKEKGKVRYT